MSGGLPGGGILKLRFDWYIKQIATAGATTAAVTEKVWGEYVSVVCLKVTKRNIQRCQKHALRSLKSLLFNSPNGRYSPC